MKPSVRAVRVLRLVLLLLRALATAAARAAVPRALVPEIIEHGGEWFISDLADFQGIKLAQLKWTVAEAP